MSGNNNGQGHTKKIEAPSTVIGKMWKERGIGFTFGGHSATGPLLPDTTVRFVQPCGGPKNADWTQEQKRTALDDYFKAHPEIK